MKGFAIAFVCVIVCASGCRQGQATQKEDVGEIHALVRLATINDDRIVTITVYRDGKPFATKEVRSSWNGKEGMRTVSAIFSSLPFGPYEVRFEAPGQATMVKTTILREADKSQDLEVVLVSGQGSIVQGVGASLQELEARLKKLEDAGAALQKK